MKMQFVAGSIVLIMVVSTATADEVAAPKEAEITRHLLTLGDDNFSKREEATRHLLA